MQGGSSGVCRPNEPLTRTGCELKTTEDEGERKTEGGKTGLLKTAGVYRTVRCHKVS